MASSSPSPALDHLILFLPADPSTKLPILPKFFTDNFTITPGGFHADGATSNSLIVLKDGCYIELISFICPTEQAAKHWWGPDPSVKGWKDWCLTTTDSFEANYERVKESHGEPIKGGRKRPDGQDVKWAVTFPKGENGGQKIRGRIPFFCHDVTPRNVRVPIDEEKTKHPSGILGVQQITIIAKDQATLDATKTRYSSIFGDEGSVQGDQVRFQAERVHDVQGLTDGPKIELRLPKDDAERKKADENEFWYGDVVLAAKADDGKEAGKQERLDSVVDDVGGIWVEYV